MTGQQFERGTFDPNASERGSLATAQPLTVILSSGGEDTVTAGSTFILSLTISNQGNQGAVIDAFIDNLPPVLQTWCESTQEKIALGVDQTGEVVFRFQIPEDALPGSYRYSVTVDAPRYYPDAAPYRGQQILQVVPPLQSDIQASDPTFAIQPLTRSDQPAKLQPGETLQLEVVVLNRADRVDRFRLNCLDLPQSWITISYPQGLQDASLSLVEAHLDLNPGEQGVISVLVTPGLDALAGSYIGTLQLRSENQPTLALLDVLYLQVQPVYLMDLSFHTIVSRVRRNSGLFLTRASNQGNIARRLRLKTIELDGGDQCNYTLLPAELTLEPKQTLTSELRVKPKSPWKRPFFGGGQILNFGVAAEDVENLPLQEFPMQGTLVWEARPWWQLLPLVLAGIGVLATIIWLIWWTFLRSPAPPQILRFFSEDAEYSAAEGDFVQLGLQISEPQRIQQLEIRGQDTEGKLISGPLAFDLSEGLPSQLEPFCRWQARMLTCRSIPTDARRPADYQFSLNVIPKAYRGATPLSQTLPNIVTVQAVPLPDEAVEELDPIKIELFAPAQADYTEVLPPAAPAMAPVPAAAPATARVAIEMDASDEAVITAESISQQIVLTGLIEANGTWEALLRLPHSGDSRPYRQGQSLAGGQISIAQIEPNAAPPFVILQERGRTYQRLLGAPALPPPAEEDPELVPVDAALPLLPGQEPTELSVAPRVEVSSIFQISGIPRALIRLPGEQGFQIVQVNDSLLDGRVVVQAINADGQFPSVTLQEAGFAIERQLGNDGSATGSDGMIAVMPVAPVADAAQQILPAPPPPAAGEAAAASPTQAPGIRLNWAIANTEQLAALVLTGRDQEGVVVGAPRVLDLQQGLPPVLEPFCQLAEQTLQCQDVPTGISQAGTFTFELMALPFGEPPETPIQLTTDPIKVKPLVPVIAELLVNGQPAKPSYLLPVQFERPMPPVTLSWNVVAPPGTEVALMPSPGTVEPVGSTTIRLAPQPGNTVLTLQAKSPAGAIVTRSLTLETFLPPTPVAAPAPAPEPEAEAPADEPDADAATEAAPEAEAPAAAES